jgi:hypothetical protein
MHDRETSSLAPHGVTGDSLGLYRAGEGNSGQGERISSRGTLLSPAHD